MFIVGNIDNEGVIYTYNLNDEHLIEPFHFQMDEINDAVQLNNDHLIISTVECIYFYDYSSTSLVEVIQETNAKRLVLDDLSDHIYVISDFNIDVYRLQDYSLQNTIQLNDSIVNCHLFIWLFRLHIARAENLSAD